MHPSKLLNVYFSLLIAYLLLLLPWSEKSLIFRPDFTLLVLIYWMIRAPNLCNIGTAWFVGLLVDLATGGTFGQYAWAYTVAGFFTVLYQRRLALFSSLQQLFYVLIVLMISQIVLLILRTFSGATFTGWIYFAPSAVGVMLWGLSYFFRLHTDGRSGRI